MSAQLQAAHASAPGGPLVALAGVASRLLGRAVGASLAASDAPGAHTVVLEVQQRPESPDRLGLRVCDDGLPLPDAPDALERCVAALAVGSLLSAPLFLDSMLLVQTTGGDEAVVRRYCLRASSTAGQPPAVIPAEAAPKPPGSSLQGSVFEATVWLQPPAAAGADGGGSGLLAGQPPAAERAASAEAVVGCLQQLLGMLRVLAPPVRLLMRLGGVLLQDPGGSLQPVSGCRRLDLALDAGLGPLARFGEGMAAEFMPPSGSEAAAAGAEAAEGGQSVLDDSALMSTGTGGGGSQDGGGAADASSRSPGGVAGTAEEAEAGRTGGSDEAAPDAGSADDPPPVAAAAAAAAAQAAGQPPPLLTYVGVGEAGWGCPGAAQSFRGCRWTARAGLVLRLPDHARLRQLGLTLSGGGGGGGEGDRSGPAALPLVLFRGWGLQLEGQGRALKGLSKADWPNFGFALMGAPQAGADGTLTATLRCAQPASGARLEAAVVHLVPCEHRGLAESGKAPALSAGYEARLVRAALEAALQQLKRQCPGVVSSRRERSLARALPLLSQALARVLLASEQAVPGGDGEEEDGEEGDDGSPLEQACAMAGCQPEGLEGALGQLLEDAVAEALGGGAGEEGAAGEGGKRAREAAASGGSQAPLPANSRRV